MSFGGEKSQQIFGTAKSGYFRFFALIFLYFLTLQLPKPTYLIPHLITWTPKQSITQQSKEPMQSVDLIIFLFWAVCRFFGLDKKEGRSGNRQIGGL